MPWVISPNTGRKIKVGGKAYDRLTLQQKKNLTSIEPKKSKSRNPKPKKLSPKTKMPSSKPAMVDPSKIYLLIYSGPNLNEETVILAKTSSHHSMQKVMRWIAQQQGLGGILLSLDSFIHEEIMIETYDINYATFDHIMADPYSYGRWEEESLWAIVNRDFSKITTERLQGLMKKMKLPELDYSLALQRKFLEIYSPEICYSLGKNTETEELVPVMGTKTVGNKIMGVTPNGVSIPIAGYPKQVLRPKTK